ncbi:MAG: HAD-IIIA family hydrolase [Saprospiraceae bacterium]|nr:HAD-IIIA family hydrolase [Saprospiraceae bacterium]HRG69569.1 HAD-IIIA family hydrolase [Saprospiraceae bacterium]
MNVYQLFPRIKAIVMDIDGVCTDNKILVTEEGQFLRSMNVKDGYAIKRAIQAGLKVGVISGGRSEGTRIRFELLGVNAIYLSVENKLPVMKQILESWNLNFNEVAYIGDDIPDLEIMKQVGLPCCPSDAVPEIIDVSKYISSFSGGNGCVRDIIEKILQVQDSW